jgi:cation diffusion facilitator CzcD-associated flavoprotein CzcO
VSGIAELQGKRLVSSDGKHCEVDAIVFATGFEVADPPIAQRIVGVSGKTLASLWGGSASAYYGTMVQDCPNLFLTFGPNLYTFSSAFVIIEAQLQFIASALKAAQKNKLRTIAVNPLRFAKYNTHVQVALKDTVWNSGCTSYFIDKNGRNSTNWPWTTFYMRWKLARFHPREFLVETTL